MLTIIQWECIYLLRYRTDLAFLDSFLRHCLQPPPLSCPNDLFSLIVHPPSFVKCYDECGYFFIFFIVYDLHESFLRTLNHFYHHSASSSLKSLTTYMLIHHYSVQPNMCVVHCLHWAIICCKLQTLVSPFPQGACSCSFCAYRFQWEHKKPGMLALNLSAQNLAQIFIPDAHFYLSFTATFSLIIYTQTKIKKWGPLQGRFLDHPARTVSNEGSHVLSLYLHSNVSPFYYVCQCFCLSPILSTFQTENLITFISGWCALFYDPNVRDFAWTHWHLVIGNRSWHFNRLQCVILRYPSPYPLPHPIQVALELIYEANLLFTYFIPHYSYLM